MEAYGIASVWEHSIHSTQANSQARLIHIRFTIQNLIFCEVRTVHFGDGPASD